MCQTAVQQEWINWDSELWLQGCSLTTSLLFPNDPPSRTLPSPQPHRVEFLVVATKLTRVVITGCDLGTQGEDQHTDGGQPHEDTPAGREGGERRGRTGPGAGWALGTGLGSRDANPQTGRVSVWDDEQVLETDSGEDGSTLEM